MSRSTAAIDSVSRLSLERTFMVWFSGRPTQADATSCPGQSEANFQQSTVRRIFSLVCTGQQGKALAPGSRPSAGQGHRSAKSGQEITMRSVGDQTVQISMTRLSGPTPETSRPGSPGACPLRASLRFVVRGCGTSAAPQALIGAWPVPAAAATAKVSPSCGLPGLPDASPEQLSSSSLPPSLAPGRRTTAFLPGGTASRGAAFFMAGAR